MEKPDLSGKSVLLVEDNELNLEIAKMLLEDEKMVVTTAENGEKAVDIVSQSVPGRFDFHLDGRDGSCIESGHAETGQELSCLF